MTAQPAPHPRRTTVGPSGFPLPSRSLASAAGRLLRTALFLPLFLLGFPALAHDPGLSSLEVLVDASTIEARMTLAAADTTRLAPERGAQALGSATGTSEGAFALALGGRPLPAVPLIVLRSGDAVHFVARWKRPDGAALSVRSLIPARLAAGHRQFVTVRQSDGTVLAEKILDASHDTCVAPLGATREADRAAGFARFVALGVAHILTGWDHLAFLFALLLVGPRLREAAQVITSFTAAHSITLGLAALDVVRVSPAVVEPLIAASVLYVGVENLVRPDPRGRWRLTFCFGLVHGFGFASVLRDMDIARTGLGAIRPLAGFNAGVEIGQLAVAGAILPLVWLLGRRQADPVLGEGALPRHGSWWVPAGSTAVALAGAVWLLQRIPMR